MTLSKTVEATILSHYVRQRREIEHLVQTIIRSGVEKRPFSDSVRNQITELCKTINSRRIPRSKLLKDQDKQNIGRTLATFTVIEACGSTNELIEDSPLSQDLKVNNTLLEVLRVTWESLWPWLRWIDENMTAHLSAEQEPSQLQMAALNSLSNLVFVYSTHSPDLMKLLLAAPGLIPILTLHHLQDHLKMQFAMRIFHLTSRADDNLRINLVSQIIEASKVEGKDGATHLAQTTARQLTQLLNTPAEEWSFMTGHAMRGLFGFLESITCDHVAVRDALVGAKVITTTIKIIVACADGKVPIGSYSSMVVRRAVSYLRTLVTIMKNATWVSQAVKGGLIQALLKSVRVTQDTEDSQHAEWMVGVFLPQCLMLYSLLVPIEKVCNSAEVKGLTRSEKALGVLWRPWNEFLQYKQSRSLILAAFEKDPTSRTTKCSEATCNVWARYQEFKVCQQCKVVYYCSLDCQKQDWPTHKVGCKYNQDCRHAETFPKIASEDLSFVTFAARYDVRHRQAHIYDLIEEFYENNPSDESPLVVYIDYVKVPFTVSINSISSFDVGPDEEIKKHDWAKALTMNDNVPRMFGRSRLHLQALVQNGKGANLAMSQMELSVLPDAILTEFLANLSLIEAKRGGEGIKSIEDVD